MPARFAVQQIAASVQRIKVLGGWVGGQLRRRGHEQLTRNKVDIEARVAVDEVNATVAPYLVVTGTARKVIAGHTAFDRIVTHGEMSSLWGKVFPIFFGEHHV